MRVFAFILLYCLPLAALADRPNVLFLAVDDMNDFVGFLGGYAGEVHSPYIDRLAGQSVAFTNAHCPSPICCPSRAAVLLGKLPSTTGIYNNGHWWKPHLSEAVSLPVHFRENGYRVHGAGKIFHHTAGNNPPEQWDSFQRIVFNDDPWFRGYKLNYPWSRSGAAPEGFPFSKVPNLPSENDWGALPNKPESDYDDAHTVDYACDFLQQSQDKPFFLACGLFRPHLPWYAPQKYFDHYPLDSIELPAIPEDDLDDIPKEGRALSKTRRADFTKVKEAGRWKNAMQAYLASISFADAQLGRVLDALENSPHRDNTIIVLWSDHGWHLGEKNHWHKMTLWEEATRVPLTIYVPSMQGNGESCAQPASLIDLYPTLIELCDLSPRDDLDGQSLVPLLRDPSSLRDEPAIIEYQRGQCAVRSRHFRYIRYADGSEELYDHRTDPSEWTNLANRERWTSVKASLSAAQTSEWAPPAPSKSAYHFDPATYSWKVRSATEDR